MVIVVKNHIPSCNTNAEGEVLLALISDALRDQGQVVLDFTAVPNATSSFVNSAFVPLLWKHSFPMIKARLRVVNAHPQVASMIRDRMNYESHRIPSVA